MKIPWGKIRQSNLTNLCYLLETYFFNTWFTNTYYIKINFPNVRNSTALVNSLMNITIFLKFIFFIDAFREYNSHLQDITS